MEVPDYRPQQNNTFRVSNTKPRRRMRAWLLLCTALTGITLSSFLAIDFLAQAPADFPTGEVITIPPGSGVKSIATLLEEKHIVQSHFLLYAVIYWYHDPKALKASTYRFSEPTDVYAVAQKLVTGDFVSNLIHFTHPEGERATEIAVHAKNILSNFDIDTFLRLAVPQEGKLFPDTYLVPPDFSATDLVKTMTDEYVKNVSPLRTKIASSTLTENEIITLASIIEREANSPESMRMVSGILQNRLKIGMALQTDASIEYILNKPLNELTAKDLEIDSPYNTYSHKELPPTPIGNPGLVAITAVVEPTPSEFLYYITDHDGNFHYAKTFEEHKINVARYLK